MSELLPFAHTTTFKYHGMSTINQICVIPVVTFSGVEILRIEKDLGKTQQLLKKIKGLMKM